MRHPFAFACLLPIALFAACDSNHTSHQKCDADSTLGVVQSVFETRGCTASTCHGADPSEAAASLDLRPDALEL